MKLYIKNMVCDRCKLVVKNEIENLGFQLMNVELGEAVLSNNITDEQKEKIKLHLEKFGFELIDDKRSRLIENIKKVLIDLVQNKNAELKTNLSVFLSQNLNQDYSKLSNLFSEVEGSSIEKYFITLKIEKVKELMIYDELSLSEIADYLNYSSAAHLSKQFKKLTGFTPTHFKHIKQIKRIQIDKL
jgi:AraC-like DNA-binding protein